MLIHEAQKFASLCTPEINGCYIGEFVPLPAQPHVLMAGVDYSFVIPVEVHEIEMNNNAGVLKLIRQRIIVQLLAMIDDLEKTE